MPVPMLRVRGKKRKGRKKKKKDKSTILKVHSRMSHGTKF